MRILNANCENGFHFSYSIPRAGCTAVSYFANTSETTTTATTNTTTISNEKLMVFGGISHNGYIYNTIEEYTISSDGSLLVPEKHTKK